MDRAIQHFDNKTELSLALSRHIHGRLSRILHTGGRANLALSGGSTPAGLFARLAALDLDWSRINLTLADERCVPASSDASNEHLVRTVLMRDRAKNARFFPLANGSETDFAWLQHCREQLLAHELLPFDILVLGMGNDGHTASLFPCSDNIEHMMSPDNHELLGLVSPATAPHLRVSFTLSTLLLSRKVILHITGRDKLAALEKAMAGKDVLEMPVRAFLQAPGLDMDIYWAPNSSDSLQTDAGSDGQEK